MDSPFDLPEVIKTIRLENIRAIELRFDTIKKNKDQYILMQDGIEFATIAMNYFSDRVRTRLESLSEWELTID